MDYETGKNFELIQQKLDFLISILHQDKPPKKDEKEKKIEEKEKKLKEEFGFEDDDEEL